ncbi:chemotaxis protein CheW [Massilia sp. TSP1-1-2]|uniref:chemotaxis protein CheW n=1 Tax=unclassified Massilia TaxID=2609279 RepID=UPI003CE8645D
MSAAAHSTPQRAVQSDGAGRRTRLRQYQVQLLERMQAARNNAGARVNQLGVQMGPERFLLDLTQVGEIVPVPSVTVVPLTQSWYLGLANVRGNLISVIDLARYQMDSETAIGSDSRLITFANGLGFNCALLVSRVYGLRHAAGMETSGERLRDADAVEWTPLDLAALVAETRFLHVGF